MGRIFHEILKFCYSIDTTARTADRTTKATPSISNHSQPQSYERFSSQTFLEIYRGNVLKPKIVYLG